MNSSLIQGNILRVYKLHAKQNNLCHPQVWISSAGGHFVVISWVTNNKVKWEQEI